MSKNQKALAQLKSINIDSKIENDTVYVFVGDVQIEIAQFEIDFRAKLYDEESIN